MNQVFNGNSPDNFVKLGDEEVVLHARRGNASATEYLLSKYKGLVEGKARSYYLAGADHEDVVQEGMIGLFKAIRDYRQDRLAGFRAFAEICVTRQIITAVKSATRQKHIPLNRCVSLQHDSSDAESGLSLIEVIPDNCVVDPEKTALDSSMRDYLKGNAGELSVLEFQVLRYYMQGMSYEEMARLLCCHTKSVDNALQRAKRKLGERIAAD